MKIKQSIKIIIFSLITFCSSNLFAQIRQFTASPGVSDSQLTIHSDFNLLQAFFHQNKSYECSIVQTYLEDYNRANAVDYWMFAQNVTDRDSQVVNVNFNGNAFPPLSTYKGLHASNVVSEAHQARQRFSVVAEKTGQYSFSLENVFPVGIGTRSLFSCRETTLYGSYNRFYAETPIVEILNKARVQFQVFITVIGADGTVIVNKQPRVVNANTRTDIILAALPAGTFGQIIITHTAPFGALEGVVAEYNQGANGTIVLRRERALEIADRS